MATSAALVAAAERPSAVSAATVEWSTMPQTPIATTTSGSKVHVCGSHAPGIRCATEALANEDESTQERTLPRAHSPKLMAVGTDSPAFMSTGQAWFSSELFFSGGELIFAESKKHGQNR